MAQKNITVDQIQTGTAEGDIPVLGVGGKLDITVVPTGTGSGLDAASLEGNTASAFATAGHTHPEATTSVAGLMSASDKTKLNGVEAGATADLTANEILTLIKSVDGAASGLDADLLDGVQPSTGESANTIVQRDANGYIHNSYFNMSADTTAVTASKIAIETSSDGYLRWQTPAQFIANHNIATGTSGLTDTGHSYATNGYQKFSNGLILQWGASSATTVTFPIAFPTACLNVIVTPTYETFIGVTAKSTTSHTVSTGLSRYWYAIGY